MLEAHSTARRLPRYAVDTTRQPRQRDEDTGLSRHGQADLLLDQHWEALCRYARSRVRDQAAVEDVVQETVLAALRDHERFREEAAVRTWLIGILRHKIADHWRQLHRRETHESDEIMDVLFDERGAWRRRPGEWVPDPGKLSEDDDFWRVVEGCLDSLPAQTKSVFTLRVIEEIPGDGVCKALGISATNLWVLLHRARLRLRACLEKHWFSDERSGSA